MKRAFDFSVTLYFEAGTHVHEASILLSRGITIKGTSIPELHDGTYIPVYMGDLVACRFSGSRSSRTTGDTCRKRCIWAQRDWVSATLLF